MKKSANPIFAACAVLGLTLVAAMAAPDKKAPDPETVAAVKALMKTLQVKEQMGPAMEGVKKMQDAMIAQQKLSNEEKAAAREIMATSMEEVQNAMSWDNLEGIMVRAYASVFTADEVKALDEMFQSPAGRTFVKKQAQLQAATMKEMQAIMLELMPKIQAKTQEAIERVKNQQRQQN